MLRRPPPPVQVNRPVLLHGDFWPGNILWRDGRLVAVIDWEKRPLPVGPDLSHKLAREQVVEEMEIAGYALTSEPDVLPYQYFLIFTPRH